MRGRGGGCCYAHISYSDKTSVGFSDTNITIKPCEPLKLHTSYRRLFTYWINVHSLRGTQMHSNVEHIGKQQFKLQHFVPLISIELQVTVTKLVLQFMKNFGYKKNIMEMFIQHWIHLPKGSITPLMYYLCTMQKYRGDYTSLIIHMKK